MFCVLALACIIFLDNSRLSSSRPIKTPLPPLRQGKKGYELIATFPHDKTCFTQGLEFHNGLLYESTGLLGHSRLQVVHPDTGEILKRTFLDKNLFGEGITIVGDRVYMLTWKNMKMLVFHADTLELIRSHDYTTHSGQGWGITTDGKFLIVSDGSSTLNFFEFPEDQFNGRSLIKVKEVKVVSNRTPVSRINELEFIDGYIYANIWYIDRIVKIDPVTGFVVQVIDFRDLNPRKEVSKSKYCFNGIAYNSTYKSVVVTGKLWEKYYSIKLK